MLLELYVKNFALIDELRIHLKPGLTVLTGETGAGKSIVVGALEQFLGVKTDPDWIRAGESEAIIEAVIDASDQPEVGATFAELGINEPQEIILRRHLSREGRNRIYVNGHSITLAQLKDLGSKLIDISGQHDQRILHNEANHAQIFDRVLRIDSGFSAELQRWMVAHQRFQSDDQEYQRITAQAQNRDQRIDYLKFQIEEIDKLHLKDEGEEEVLKDRRSRLRYHEQLQQLAQRATETLYAGEQALIGRLEALFSEIASHEGRDPSLAQLHTHYETARASLDEIRRFFSDYAQEEGGGDLESIETRLFAIQQLKRKFGASLSEVLDHYQQMKAELAELESAEDRLQKIAEQRSVSECEALDRALALSAMRHRAAPKLTKMIQQELKELSLPNVVFRVVIQTPTQPALGACCASGIDDICFEFSANPGEPPKPLTKIASGGELSRILLAIKRVLRTNEEVGTLVFDEIDAGIGGAVAEVVGRKLKQIAQGAQVLCVTHLPQVAVQADQHFVIEKAIAARTTRTGVRYLDQEGMRVEEVARMLGGLQLTDKTRAHAKEMMKRGRA